jgi:uncharacterized membrane protein YccC
MALFTQTLRPSTRMALQAAFAVTIAIVFGHLFHFERSYWAILTTMVLTGQTRDQSIKKSLNRISMTIVGGITGTLLFFCIKDSHYALLSCLLLCIYFVVFFLETSYLCVVFFITNLVVFLFALLQGWTLELLTARIEETIIGAIIAITTSALIFPSRIKNQYAQDLNAFHNLAAEISTDCINALLQYKKSFGLLNKKKLRLLKLINLLDSHNKTNHVIFSYSQAQKRVKSQLLTLNILCHYLISMIETLPYLANNPSLFLIKDELVQVGQVIDNNFALLQAQIPSDTALNDLTDLKLIILNKIALHIQQDTAIKQLWLEFYSFFYFTRRVNELVIQLSQDETAYQGW